MKTSELTFLIRKHSTPKTFLQQLRQHHFSLQDRTQEGDTIFSTLWRGSFKELDKYYRLQELIHAPGFNFLDEAHFIFQAPLPFSGRLLSQFYDFLLDQSHFYCLLNQDPIPFIQAIQKNIGRQAYQISLITKLLTHPHFALRQHQPTLLSNTFIRQHIALLTTLLNHPDFQFNGFVMHVVFALLRSPGELEQKIRLLQTQLEKGVLTPGILKWLIATLLGTREAAFSYLQAVLATDFPFLGQEKWILNALLTSTLKKSEKTALLSTLFNNNATALDEDAVDYFFRDLFRTTLKKTQKSEAVHCLAKKTAIDSCHLFKCYGKGILTLNQLDALLRKQPAVDIEYGFNIALNADPSTIDQNLIEVLYQIAPLAWDDLKEKLTRLVPPYKDKAMREWFDRFKFYKTYDPDSFTAENLITEKNYVTRLFNNFERQTTFLAHVFSLGGSILNENATLDLEGEYFDFTAFYMSVFISSFMEEIAASKPEYLPNLIEIRNIALKAWRFGKSISLAIPFPRTHLIEHNSIEPIEILTGWDVHALTILVTKNAGYLIRCNGGEGRTDATMEIYKVTRPENFTPELVDQLVENSAEKNNKLFIQDTLHKILGLKLAKKVAGTAQTVGNCTFESLIISFEAKLHLFFDENIAKAIHQDFLTFIQKVCLNRYIQNFSKHRSFSTVIMRLILNHFLPLGKIKEAIELLESCMESAEARYCVRIETLLEMYFQQFNNAIPQEITDLSLRYEADLLELSETLFDKIQLLDRFLKNQMETTDWAVLETQVTSDLIFQGYSLLHITVLNNNVEACSRLIKLFPELLHQKDWHFYTPLAYVRSVEVAQLLIANGASVSNGVLDVVISYGGSYKLIKTLLESGATITGDTAARVAENPALLKLLLQYRPEICHRKNRENESLPFFVDDVEILAEIIYQGADPDAVNVNGHSPLSKALKNGKVQTATYLAKHPAVVPRRPHRGEELEDLMPFSPGTCATLQGFFDSKNHYLQYYTEVFANSQPYVIYEDVDALLTTLMAKNLPATYGCLQAYPHLSVCQVSHHYGIAPLHQAILNLKNKDDGDYPSHFKLLKKLLKTKEILINTTTDRCETPLHLAVFINNEAVVMLLLKDENINLNQASLNGETALDLANRLGHTHLATILRQHQTPEASCKAVL